MMHALKFAVAALLLVIAVASQASAQDAISKARDLYAAAEYEEALTLLDAMSAEGLADRQAVNLYKTLCLIAVGRRDDADKTIEVMIALDPKYRPGDDISPKMRSVFAEARKRLLPALVQQNYLRAKNAFDRKEFAAAASGFKEVVDTMSDPDMAHAVSQPPLADIRTLASGFHDLSLKAIPPPPPPTPAQPVAPPPPPRIYAAEDRQVTAPVAIQQELPRYPGRVRPGGMTGVLEVVINEAGLVESSTALVSLGQPYDDVLAAAVTKWQYYPARLDGQPVKFRKRIQITVSSQPGT
jgi:hypothetical protein